MALPTVYDPTPKDAPPRPVKPFARNDLIKLADALKVPRTVVDDIIARRP